MVLRPAAFSRHRDRNAYLSFARDLRVSALRGGVFPTVVSAIRDGAYGVAAAVTLSALRRAAFLPAEKRMRSKKSFPQGKLFFKIREKRE